MIYPYQYYVITSSSHYGAVFFYLKEKLDGIVIVRSAQTLAALNLYTVMSVFKYVPISPPRFGNFSSNNIIPLSSISQKKYYYVPALRNIIFTVDGRIRTIELTELNWHGDGLKGLSCFELPPPTFPTIKNA